MSFKKQGIFIILVMTIVFLVNGINVFAKGTNIGNCRMIFTKVGELSSDSEQFEKFIRIMHGNKVLREDEDYYVYSTSWGYDDNILHYVRCGVEGIGDYTGKATFYIEPISKKPYLCALDVVNGGIKVQWEQEPGAIGYEIYRKIGSGKFSLVKTIKNNATISWKDTSATKIGTKYSYYIKAYTKTGSIVVYTDKSNTETVTRFKAPKMRSVANGTNGVVVKWNKVAKVKYYDVLRKTQNGNWKYIGGSFKNTYTDRSAKSGVTYYYTVRCCDDEWENSISGYDTNGKKIYYLKRTTVSLKNTSSGMKVTWKKSAGATGYQIQYSTSSTFSKGNKSVNVTGSTSKTMKGLTKGKKYYVRVRAYKTISGKKRYAAWSSKKSLSFK